MVCTATGSHRLSLSLADHGTAAKHFAPHVLTHRSPGLVAGYSLYRRMGDTQEVPPSAAKRQGQVAPRCSVACCLALRCTRRTEHALRHRQARTRRLFLCKWCEKLRPVPGASCTHQSTVGSFCTFSFKSRPQPNA